MFQQYYSSDSPEQLLQQSGMLSLIKFNSSCEPPVETGLIPVGLKCLAGLENEIISMGDKPITRGMSGRCHWSYSDNITCTSIWLSASECGDIENSTYKAYVELFRFIESTEHPNAFRIWNFIPNINQGDGDLEEYKKFCTGRLRAFTELGIPAGEFPAASALGHREQGAVIYVLSSSEHGVPYENPKQESAYRYPRQYGPSSPSFSRSTYIQLGEQKLLFISGTAGILGYETQAPGNLPLQLETTFSNIETLIGLTQTTADAVQFLRVYIRHSEDFAYVSEQVNKRFPGADISYVLADICRNDLLLEIEATVNCSP